MLIVIVSASSCETDHEVTYDPDIIVEAYLHEGKVISIQLSQEIPFRQDDYIEIEYNELNVIIKDENKSLILGYEGEGLFVGDSFFLPQVGSIYSLQIEFNNEMIESETIIPAKPSNFEASATSIEIDNSESGGIPNMSGSIDLFWDNPEADYYILKIDNLETNPEVIFDDDRGALPNRVLQEEGTQIRPVQFKYYGTHRVVLYHINDELAAIYENQENSSLNLTDPTTNIINGYGIFTGINSDTLYIEVSG